MSTTIALPIPKPKTLPALDGSETTEQPQAAALETTNRGTTTSAGEEIACLLAGARVVKAIAPFAELLHSDSLLIEDRRPRVFVCGDDEAARAVVESLLSDIGIDGVDAGPLKRARCTEPLGMLVTNLAYVDGMGARINAVLIRDVAEVWQSAKEAEG